MPRRHRPRYYILDDDGNPQPVDDVRTWSQWMRENRERLEIARAAIGPIPIVSTMFVGVDYDSHVERESYLVSPPILFETMIVTGPHRSWTKRTATRAEAHAAHNEAIELIAKSAGQEGYHAMDLDRWGTF